MLAPRFAEQLNLQIGYEFAASTQYLAVAVHYDALTMPQMAQLFYKQAAEERNHALMMVQYLLDTGGDVHFPAVPAPIGDFHDLVAPVALAVEQERRVTQQVYDLTRIAREENDFGSEQFMNWFIKEQVEEVAKMTDLLTVVRRAGGDAEAIEDYVSREASTTKSDPTAPRMAGA